MGLKAFYSKKFTILFLMIIISLFYSYNFLETQEVFDPSSVQSKECQSGKMLCGFIPEPPEVLEAIPLAESTMISHRGLPSRVDFSKDIPPVMNQGRQNSCVAFSTGYYTKSYYEYKKHKWKYDPPLFGGKGENVFSPAYIYNQINGGKDRGSYFHDALNLVVQKGIVPWKYMPYKEEDYLTQPVTSLHQIAGQFKAKSYRRIPFDNLEAIKTELANGNTIIFGMVIDDNFYQLGSEEKYIYDTPGGKPYGGHAMTLVGYDDHLRSQRGDIGAFKLVNSWGRSWADKGFGWISYRMWLQLRPYVYVLYDDYNIQNELHIETDISNSYLPSPANISATKGTYNDKIVLHWNSIPSADVYGILRMDPGTTDFRIIAYTFNHVYEDKLIQPNISYYYTVISISDDKTSDLKNAVIVSGYASSKNVIDIPKIKNIKMEYKRNKIFLSWESIPEISAYQIKKWEGKRKVWIESSQLIKTNRYIEINPEKDQVHRYAIRGILNNKYGEWSDPIEIYVPGFSTPPNRPTIIDISKGLYRDKIIVKWEEVEGAQSYFVYRYDYKKNLWEGPYKSDKNEYIDQDPKIMTGESFGYIVIAKNEAGYSEYSKLANGNTNPNVYRAGEVLPPPKNISIKMDRNKVILEWEEVHGSEEYYIYRKKMGENEYRFVKSINQNIFEEVFPGTEGDIYFYIIKSKAFLGKESQNSKAVAAFLNPRIEEITHRFMPNQGMEKFLGKWIGNYWDGSSEIQRYEMQITSENEILIVNITSKNKKEHFRTQYPALSNVIRFEDFELKHKQEFDIIILEGKQKEYKGKVITFTKP